MEQVSDQLATWGAGSRRDLLRQLLCLVRRYGEAAGLRSLRHALYLKIDENWSAQLNVENIFNKGYWASADGNNNISPGAAAHAFGARQF